VSGYVALRLSPLMVLQPVAAFVVLAAWWAVFGLSWPATAIGAAGVIVAAARQVRTVGMRLRVSSRGVTLSATNSRGPVVHVPWASVREVVVLTDPITARPQVGIRLCHGAPLPAGVRGLVHDPAQPDRLQAALVREVPRLDRAALDAAVGSYGVRVVNASEM